MPTTPNPNPELMQQIAEHAASCGKIVLGQQQDPWLEIWIRSIVDRVAAGLLSHVLTDLQEVRCDVAIDGLEAVDELASHLSLSERKRHEGLGSQPVDL